MGEQLVTIANGTVQLAATLTLPQGDGPHPVVLCLHGSGPLDRDENSRSLKLNIFNTIAADLVGRGIATLRFDKRGCGKSTGDYYAAGHHDLLADAAACLDWLAADPRFGKRFVLGHSEGTLLGARLALERNLDGLVLLAPFNQPLEQVMLKQAATMDAMVAEKSGFGGMMMRLFAYIAGQPSAQQRKILARVKASDAPVIRVMLQRLPARWLRETLPIDPAEIYREVRVPTLVIGGEKDLQCDPADVPAIATAIGPAATAIVIDDLTHILRRDPGPASLETYSRLLRQPPDPELVRLVGDWIAESAGPPETTR